MNNSEIIAALSIALTAIIFLLQSDDGLLKVKFKSVEKWYIIVAVLWIVLLCNHQIFDRYKLHIYSKPYGIFLTPNEWALIIFLCLISWIFRRIFSNKIFNNNVSVVLSLLKKYRAEKKIVKLQNLLALILDLPNFRQDYAEKLNDTLFNDHYLIEYFASNCPELLIDFSNKYDKASINRGEYFYFILNGLFADKSNSIFSEIRQYKDEDFKFMFLYPYNALTDIKEFQFDNKSNYRTECQIINWLTNILKEYPINLQNDSLYFLNQFKELTIHNNIRIYTEDEIEISLSRDTLFNSIQLFRILLIELSFNDKRILRSISRVLILFYSSWDFIQDCTKLETHEVHLGNTSFTINEYLLKYIFDGYINLLILLNKILYGIENKDTDNEDCLRFIIKQLFSKVDSLIASDKVSEKSKKYYIEELFQFYFKMPGYFSSSIITIISEAFLGQMNTSLENYPWGNSAIYRDIFNKCCDYGGYDFWSESEEEKNRTEQFYKTLLPHTKVFESNIKNCRPIS